MNRRYRQLQLQSFDAAMDSLRLGDDRWIRALVESLINDVEGARIDLEQERNNRADQVRRKRNGLAITSALLREPCPTCHQVIEREAHGGEHPSAGDHDPGFHVAAAYGTTP